METVQDLSTRLQCHLLTQGTLLKASLPHMVVQFLHCMIPGTSFHIEHSIMAAPELCSAQPLQPYRAALSDAAPISL